MQFNFNTFAQDGITRSPRVSKRHQKILPQSICLQENVTCASSSNKAEGNATSILNPQSATRHGKGGGKNGRKDKAGKKQNNKTGWLNRATPFVIVVLDENYGTVKNLTTEYSEHLSMKPLIESAKTKGD